MKAQRITGAMPYGDAARPPSDSGASRLGGWVGGQAIEEEYLPLKKLARYSNIGERTLRGYLHHRSRPLPYYRVGGKVLVKLAEFDTWMIAFRVVNVSTIDAIVNDTLAGF